MKADNDDRGNRSRSNSRKGEHIKPRGQSEQSRHTKRYGHLEQNGHVKLHGQSEYDETFEIITDDEPVPEIKQYQIGSDKSEKLLSLLGFAARARRLIFGTELCRNAMRSGQISLAILASDASPNTKKRIVDACKYYGCDVCQSEVTSAILASRLGKSGLVAVVGLGDANFIRGITSI